jgi:HK97 gp10 family phage protein
MISGKIKGTKDIKAVMGALESQLISGQSQAVQQSAILIHATAVKLIQKPSNGEAQIRYRPKRNVVASKPGDAPNTDKGALIQSMKFEFNADKTKGYVGSNLKYSSHLEFGTKTMAPRPFLSVATRQSKPEISKIFNRLTNQAIKKGAK